MEGRIRGWQVAALAGIAGWVVAASFLDLTRRLRSQFRPWIARRVASDNDLILWVQGFRHRYLDSFFSLLSFVVSVPFYTGFLPILFWSGHARLARQMTLLMAFCDYVGNSVKDMVSAPRPSSSLVRRVTATEGEKESAMEYGLPSSHSLNTVCLAGYMLHYVVNSGIENQSATIAIGLAMVFLLVGLIAIGRIYLGMHSVIDIAAGVCIGLSILVFWINVHEYIDSFIVSGQNVTSFWASLSFLLCFAYPTPEVPTPSFEYHTAFNGVSFGVVSGIQQTYMQFHSDAAPRIFSPELPLASFAGRLAVGIPTILAAKACSKAMAKRLLPVVCNTLGVPLFSSCYVPALKEPSHGGKSKPERGKPPGYIQRLVLFPDVAYDVDTGIRFAQYAALAWSVVDLAPHIFSYLSI